MKVPHKTFSCDCRYFLHAWDLEKDNERCVLESSSRAFASIIGWSANFCVSLSGKECSTCDVIEQRDVCISLKVEGLGQGCIFPFKNRSTFRDYDWASLTVRVVKCAGCKHLLRD